MQITTNYEIIHAEDSEEYQWTLFQNTTLFRNNGQPPKSEWARQKWTKTIL